MKTALINPPFFKNYSRQSRSPCIAKSGTIYFPYYLAYATGALENAGHKVFLLDAVIEKWSFDTAIQTIKELSPELVIIDTSTPSINNDISFAESLKKSLPNTHVNLVGLHPSKFADNILDSSGYIDSICRGEYDFIVVNLANSLKNNNSLDNVLGLSFLNDQNIVINNPLAPKLTNEELDSLPFVSDIYLRHFGQKKIKKYFYASIKWPYIHILTARGCPYNCSFCNIPSKGSYRTRSIKNVIGELEFIKTKMPFINEIFIEDDTFPANKKRTIELCDQIIQNQLNTIDWSCNARVNTDIQVLKIMKKAGCRLVCVGFESISQNALDSVQKKTTAEMQINFMREVNKIGIKVNGCFIVGLPGDTVESIQETISFSKILLPNTAQFYPHMIYPGTDSFEWAKHNNYLISENWDDWLTKDGLHNTIISLPGLSSTDLMEWANKGRLQFYTNPKFLIKMVIQSLTKPKEAIRMMIGLKTFSKYLFKYFFTIKQ